MVNRSVKKETVKPPSFDVGVSRKDRRILDKVKGKLNESEKTEPLLTIELQDESSVPKVFYKGKEVTAKINVSFDWLTGGAGDPPGLSYAIENIEHDNLLLTTNRIERRCGVYAGD